MPALVHQEDLVFLDLVKYIPQLHYEDMGSEL